MRFIILATAITLAGCSSADGAEKDLAQCRLDAHGRDGEKFQKSYVSISTDAREAEDESYGSFLVTCMEAKGFQYPEPHGDDGKLNKLCWAEKNNGGMSPTPWVGGASCYKREWW